MEEEEEGEGEGDGGTTAERKRKARGSARSHVPSNGTERNGTEQYTSGSPTFVLV